MLKSLNVAWLRQLPEFDNHKKVWLFKNREAGLHGFIAIHSDKLGPAVGGTRYWAYKNENNAIRDVLRLSRAMSYKCALAGVKFGGGKAVIFADSNVKPTPKSLEAYASVINEINGQFFTGEDVGLVQSDIDYLRLYSRFIIGASRAAGDPSPWAALGVFYSIRAVADKVFGKKIGNISVSIKGLGKVGSSLCQLLYDEGAEIIAADVNKATVREMKLRFPKIKFVEPKNAHIQKVDFFSPCALGIELNPDKVLKLNCKAVCGGANNQLENPETAGALFLRGIFYVPDYISNSGGLINVVDELNKDGYNLSRVTKHVKKIYDRVEELIKLSKKTQKSPNVIAENMSSALLH